jgi:hypothetical protein
MAMIMKDSIFLDVTPCGSCKNRCIDGAYRLLRQGGKSRRAANNVSNNQKTNYSFSA